MRGNPSIGHSTVVNISMFSHCFVRSSPPHLIPCTQADISELQKLLDAQAKNTEVKAAMDKLNQSAMKIGEAVYKSKGTGGGASEAKEDGKKGNTVDAEFEEKEKSK